MPGARVGVRQEAMETAGTPGPRAGSGPDGLQRVSSRGAQVDTRARAQA